MKIFKWQYGRQAGGYEILPLVISKFLKFDCYILKFPSNSFIDWHIDPAVDGYEHHRINITIKRAKFGGEFFYTPINRDGSVSSTEWWAGDGRIFYFRPDIQRHRLTKVRGDMWILSFGWLNKCT